MNEDSSNTPRLANVPEFHAWRGTVDDVVRETLVSLWQEQPKNVEDCHDWARWERRCSELTQRFCAYAATAASAEELQATIMAGTPAWARRDFAKRTGTALPEPRCAFAHWLRSLQAEEFFAVVEPLVPVIAAPFDKCLYLLKQCHILAEHCAIYCHFVLQAQSMDELEEAMLYLQPSNWNNN